jgi:CheY-like chemotaxis protein
MQKPAGAFSRQSRAATVACNPTPQWVTTSLFCTALPIKLQVEIRFHPMQQLTDVLSPTSTSDLTPESPVAAVLPPAIQVTAYDPASQPILVADDDPDDTYFIQRLIKKTGVPNPVKVFDDGSEVVNYLGARAAATATQKHKIPLLLFLDLKMTGLGGFGFLEWARTQKQLMPLTMVVLSNSNAPEDVQRALELGAHRYLVKYPCAQTISTIVRSVYPQTVY